MIAPDQATVLRKSEMKFGLQDVGLHSTNVTVLGGLKFETEGTYFIEVLVDDVMASSGIRARELSNSENTMLWHVVRGMPRILMDVSMFLERCLSGNSPGLRLLAAQIMTWWRKCVPEIEIAIAGR